MTESATLPKGLDRLVIELIVRTDKPLNEDSVAADAASAARRAVRAHIGGAA